MNKGFDAETIREYRARMAANDVDYLIEEEEEPSDEYCHFYFIGTHEDREVIYDAVMYTLRLAHESEMHEIAEQRAAEQFPGYDPADESISAEREEEIGMFMAEVIMELEEEGTVKVREHVDVDQDAEFGIALDIGLHRPRITPQEIQLFIQDFNAGTLTLDDRHYSFQTESFTD